MKRIKKVCGNCKLFDPSKQECAIVVLHEGQRLHIPVDPKDKCFFDEDYFDPITGKKENLVNKVGEVKIWVEDESGEKTSGNGTVKIEYPQGFLGVLDVKNPKNP